MLCFVIIENPLGREPWPSGYGRHLMMRGCGFESWCRRMDMKFFTLICCKNCIVCLKRPKINGKEAGVGPFLKIENPLCSKSNFLSFIFCYFFLSFWFLSRFNTKSFVE